MRTLSLIAVAVLGLLGGCRDRFSPDVYATRAVQQADKVEQGIIVGVRKVRVSADGTTGAATGAAAGGVLGAQAPGSGIVSALGGVGGALVGGLLGQGAEHAVVDTDAYEYIVRTSANALMRVTQQDREPLQRGQQVLLIMGSQARVVPDYTLAQDGSAAHPPALAGSPRAHPAPHGGEAPAAAAPAEGVARATLPDIVTGAATAAASGSAASNAVAVGQALGGTGTSTGTSAIVPATPAYPPTPPAPPAPRNVDTQVTDE